MKFDPLPHIFGHSGSSEAPSAFAGFSVAIVAELAEAVPTAQRRGFYLAVGRRMAAGETLDGVDDLSEFARRINAFWADQNWGQADISIEHDAIVVRHGGAPAVPADSASGPWLGMLLAVLEGAYDAWFRKLGSGPTLHTRGEWKGDTVELHHGR